MWEVLNPLSVNLKMVKHTQTVRRCLPTNCFTVFDHFAGLALKGLLHEINKNMPKQPRVKFFVHLHENFHTYNEMDGIVFYTRQIKNLVSKYLFATK